MWTSQAAYFRLQAGQCQIPGLKTQEINYWFILSKIAILGQTDSQQILNSITWATACFHGKAVLRHLHAWVSGYVDICVALGLFPASLGSYGHPSRTHGHGLLILKMLAMES